MVAYRFQVGELVRVQIGILPKGGGALIDQTFSTPVGSLYQVTRLMPPLVYRRAALPDQGLLWSG